jgi:hypothetical protein
MAMAHLLRFRKPIVLVGGVTLDYIYNVSNPVGPGKFNQPDDVHLVQFLLKEYETRAIVPGTALLPLPAVSENFDDLTAVWVYYLQFKMKKENPGSVLDGIVSPARGLVYNLRTEAAWFIAALNYSLKDADSNRFDALMDNPLIKSVIKEQITI